MCLKQCHKPPMGMVKKTHIYGELGDGSLLFYHVLPTLDYMYMFQCTLIPFIHGYRRFLDC